MFGREQKQGSLRGPCQHLNGAGTSAAVLPIVTSNRTYFLNCASLAHLKKQSSRGGEGWTLLVSDYRWETREDEHVADNMKNE